MSYQAVVAFFSGTGKVADRPPNLLPYAMIQAVLFCEIPVVLRNLFLPRALEPRRQRKAVTYHSTSIFSRAVSPDLHSTPWNKPNDIQKGQTR
jgi:hypothetical protein